MRLDLTLAALVLFASPALPNDGFGGLSGTGLTFGQTDAVAMVSEDLFIGLDRISVDYIFENKTDQDVTGEVIFPLPPILVSPEMDGLMNLPQDLTRDNLVNFTATVDGQPIAVQIDRIAVIEEPWEENRPLSAQYDTPGRDVTADLARFGLPLTLDRDQLRSALSAMPVEEQTQAAGAGLIVLYPSEGDGFDAFPLWSVVIRYHWRQTFPAGKSLAISHTYENLPAGGVFSWTTPVEDYATYLLDQYCIDDGTSRAITKALSANDGAALDGVGMSYNISYVLRTANSWAGPIGSFRLTLDKGAAENVISLCADGVKKTGPTTFVIEKTNYTPDRDLEILVVLANPPG